MIPKTLVPTPRISEEGEEIDLDPEQLAKTTQKERNMSHARGESMLNLTATSETLIQRASEQAAHASTVVI